MHRCKCVETHTTNYVVRRVIMKEKLCFILGAFGAWIAGWFGGWNSAMTTLLLFMLADYLTGLIVAGVFKNSPKTATGTLQSKAGLIGLIKKCMILFMLLIACRLDILLNTTVIRDGTCISFIINELISITENAGLMGIPIPPPIKRAIDVLKSKEESQDKEDSGESENVHKLK